MSRQQPSDALVQPHGKEQEGFEWARIVTKRDGQIVSKLRQVDVLIGQGITRMGAFRGMNFTGLTQLPLAQAVWRDGDGPVQATPCTWLQIVSAGN